MMPQSVSVVVATYRRDVELKAALDSLAAQDYPDFEIVVVDDNGSMQWNQRVKSVVERFANDHPELCVRCMINPENQGSAQARNIGIGAAVGKYVTFLDDDDLYLPEKIAKQVAFMEAHRLDYSITDLKLYNEKDRLIDQRTRSYIQDFSQQAMVEYHFKYHITGTDTMMFRKEYLDRIGGFPPIDIGDEFYLMQRAIEANGKFGYLSGCDVKAYVHNDGKSLSCGKSKIHGEKQLYMHKKLFFDRLSKRTIRYIRTRHYAVMAYTYMRRHCYMRSMLYLLCSVISSPESFFSILFRR